MRKINRIIVHCAYTKPSMDIGAKDIKKWHTDPKPTGNGWSDIGYHYVIRRDGLVEDGRDRRTMGAHTYGHNADSLGICLVGGKSEQTDTAEFNFTHKQMRALRHLVWSLVHYYEISIADVHGHNEYASKECPCFDVQEFFKDDKDD